MCCNPVTQIRDLDLLLNHFKISKIQPVDMFPHTDHGKCRTFETEK